ncbi:MAG: amino acid ABC transporter permease [Clostridiales bacterium]|jgi:polar amino acid transport system permease protein|nr:amino acid ABC transporter permease [Clostridiales bacterium]
MEQRPDGEKPYQTKKFRATLAIILAALAVAAVFAAVKPSRGEMSLSLSEDLIADAGDRYSETYSDYVVFNIIRGKNVKTAATDTFMGFAGRIYNVNDGFMTSIADVILWLPALMGGARITVLLTIAATFAGIFLSVFLALGKISKNKAVNKFCGAYIFFFRGSPLLMQLFFIYYGLPQISPVLAINNKFLAAFIAFSLNSGAYCAEIIRAAIQSIEKGQFEASSVLGLTYAQTMRLIIIPQSIRRLIPPVANEFIMMLKDASLVSMIALSDLTHVTRSISSSASSVLVYIPAMIIYLVITALFTFIFTRLEKRFSLYQ